MSSKRVGDADRAAAPVVQRTETLIGQDAVGVVVRRQVLDGGLASVDRDQQLGGPLSSAFVADQPRLGLLAVDGVLPTARTMADRTYALSRPQLLVTDGPPAGAARTFVEHVLSPAGQELLTRHGYLTLAQLKG